MGRDRGTYKVAEGYPPAIGSKIRTTYGNSLDKVYHVRGHVDGHLTLRWWSRSKQRWIYEVRGGIWFTVARSHLEIEPPKDKP